MMKILIIEDDPMMGSSLAQKIRKSGHEVVRIVANPENAIKVSRELSPDAIVCDVNLANNTCGVETMREINKEGNPIPVIFVSALSEDELLERISGYSHPYRLLPKPVMVPSLRNRFYQLSNTAQ